MIKFKKLSRKISWVTMVLFLAMTIFAGVPAQPAQAASSVGGLTISADKDVSTLGVGDEFTVTINLLNATLRGVDFGIKWAPSIIEVKNQDIFGDIVYEHGCPVPTSIWLGLTGPQTSILTGKIDYAGAFLGGEKPFGAKSAIYNIKFVVKAEGSPFIDLFVPNAHPTELDSQGFIYSDDQPKSYAVPASSITNSLLGAYIGTAPADTTAPVITLLGSASVNVANGAAYTDAGATANDNIDGDITANIVTTITNNVDAGTTFSNTKAATYTYHYNVKDAANNAATEVTRTVIVAAVVPDTTAPAITLLGSASVNVANGAAYTDAGATANDNIDGDITANIVTTITNNVDAGTTFSNTKAATYTYHYNVKDAANNAATEVTRTVIVAAVVPDTTAPVITLLGSASVNVANGDAYTDAGATANDNIDGDITSNIVTTITNDVDAGTTFSNTKAATYTYHYNVKDAANNAATEVTRTVIVAAVVPDTTVPVITLLGSASVNVANGAAYTDAGATANDNIDGDITSNIVTTITNDVDAGTTFSNTKAATYTYHYNVKDAANNVATEVTRTVIVAAVVPDTTVPVITLLGSASVNVANGAAYTDAGATANDNIDGDITANIVTTITNDVDAETTFSNTKAATYTYHYNVKDAANNAATEVTRTVIVAAVVPDTTAPVITLLGSASVNVANGDAYTDAGATANDNIDGDITANIVTTITNNVDAGTTFSNTKAATYTYHYNVKDAANNAATEVTRTVIVAAVVPDTTAPVITLLGSASVNVANGDAYTDAGATANDNIDGDITSNIVTTITNDVDAGTTFSNTKAATYTYHYNVKDAANNAATEVTRTVIVAAVVPDTTVPVITLLGSASVNVANGAAYTDAGATANDNIDGDITSNIVTTITNDVDAGTTFSNTKAATYTYHYNVKDAANNVATEVTRTVIVAAVVPDTTVPVITLLGSASVNVANGAAYTDAGATANDNIDGDITANIVTTITNDVDAETTFSNTKAATYTYHYNVKDAANNAATEVTRTVIVAAVVPDTTAPVITLLGSASVNVANGDAYTDAGATANDNIDGDITSNIVTTITNDVDAGTTFSNTKAATYTYHYNVKDAANNAATEVTRTVIVAAVVPDTTVPVITLLGSASVNVANGATYTDAGATANDNIDGDITANIVTTITNDVDAETTFSNTKAATYTYHYNVKDAANNAATEVTRTVIVAAVVPDTTAPVITLLGSASVNVANGDAYTDAGATANDNIDGDITSNIVTTITNDVDAGTTFSNTKAATYTYHYNVKDAANNAATEVTRTVIVAAVVPDTTVPVITLLGSASVNVANGAAYTDAGATANDNIDGDITSNIVTTITNDVDAETTFSNTKAATYTYHYNVKDAANNAAIEVTRTVIVAAVVPDTTAPVITLLGSASVNVANGATYTDAGATANDNIDGDITVNIVTTITNNVDAETTFSNTKAANYTYHYNVKDAANNVAAEVTRTVIVAASGGTGGSTRSTTNTYTITTNAGEGGSFDTAKTVSVRAGASTKLNIKANDGYAIEDVNVDGKSVGMVSNYEFTNVSANHTISATFKKIEETGKDFTDVPKKAWYYEPVMMAREKGWFSGTSPTTFSPNTATTRGMIVTVLWRMEGEPTIKANSFNDVAAGNYFTNPVAWAAENSIVNGYGNDAFGPNDSITREQLASILFRYAKYKGYDVTQGGMAIREFADYDSISEYALPALAWAVNTGLVQGSNNNILPQDKATRAQVATILMRFSQNFGK